MRPLYAYAVNESTVSFPASVLLKKKIQLDLSDFKSHDIYQKILPI